MHAGAGMHMFELGNLQLLNDVTRWHCFYYDSGERGKGRGLGVVLTFVPALR